MDNFNEIFKLASKYFYKEFKKKGGSQKEIAEKLEITQTYLSSVISGSRSPSLSLMEQIAFILSNKPLDEFLVVGRRIKNNASPAQEETTGIGESPETLISKLMYYIVDRQRIEKNLEEKQWLLEQALNMASYGIIIISKDNKKVLAYNNAYKEMVGYPEEILATRDFDVYIKWNRNRMLDKKKFDKGVEETFSKKEPTSHVIKLKNGYIIERKVNRIYKNGNFAGWIAELHDVTPSKKKKSR